MKTVLKFKTKDVRELIEHVKKSKKHKELYGQPPQAGLILVKDTGIYLMSSGIPNLPNKEGGEGSHVVYAEGFDPEKDKGDDLWDRQQAAVGGDDFGELLPLNMWEGQLDLATVGVMVSEKQMAVMKLIEIESEEVNPENN